MFTTSLLRAKRSSSYGVSAILSSLLAGSFVVLGGAISASAADCEAGVVVPTINDDGDTFMIGTAAELIALSENFEFLGDPVWGEDFSFEQTADIDLAGCDWSPIGTTDSPFSGGYDGNGFTVSGLNIISTTSSDVGFFGFVDDDFSIRKLTVIGEIDIPLGSTAGGRTVGGIAGKISGEIYLSQVMADIDISIRTAAGSGNIGGLVGQVSYGTIQYSGHRGDFLVTGNKLVGGLVGSVKSDRLELKSNYSIATFDVTGLTGYDSSGIIGDGCDGVSLVTNTFSVASGQHWGVQIEDCGTFQDSFYNTTTFVGVATSDEDSVEGVLGKTTLDLKDPITYENWNIVEGWAVFNRSGGTHWGICAAVNDGYPYLLWEYSSNPCVSGGSDNSALASTGSNLGDYSGPVAGVLLAGTGLVLLGRLRRRSRIHN
jgi:hypothetical protein